MAIDVRLMPDDVVSAELLRDLKADFNVARDQFNTAHRAKRPANGTHFETVVPVAVCKLDFDTRAASDNDGEIDSWMRVRFEDGLRETPRLERAGGDYLRVLFLPPEGARFVGAEATFAWNFNAAQPTNARDVAAQFEFDYTGAGAFYIHRSNVRLVQHVTIAIFGVSPWR